MLKNKAKHFKEPTIIYKKIENIAEEKFHSSAGWIKSKEGCILMGKEAILVRWSKYIKNLFKDERGPKPWLVPIYTHGWS